MIWLLWIAVVVLCFFYKGEVIAVNFFFETKHGVSVSDMQSYFIYYGIVLLIFLPSVLFGKRVFCHYFCWMAPFMVIGIKFRSLLHFPGLHIKIRANSDCISCGKCSQECPMGIDVVKMVKEGHVENVECIQCGACIDCCSRNVLSYGLTEGSEKNYGNRKKT